MNVDKFRLNRFNNLYKSQKREKEFQKYSKTYKNPVYRSTSSTQRTPFSLILKLVEKMTVDYRSTEKNKRMIDSLIFL